MKNKLYHLLILLAMTTTGFSQKSSYNTIYVGTYTKDEGFVKGQAKGIYSLLQNSETGKVKKGKTLAEVTNPSYVKTSPNGDYLYSVSELTQSEGDSGYIYSFKINEDKSLSQLGKKLPTYGFAPCHISMDKTGGYVFVSNYIGGVVSIYKVTKNGALEFEQKLDFENPSKSHAHSTNIAPDNAHIYICDLGNDKIWIYKIDPDEDGLHVEYQSFTELKKGSGPRHMSFLKNGNYAYSVNELNSSITAFAIKKNGDLNQIQSVSTLPEGYTGNNSAAEIHIEATGNYLYASNRGHNSIVGFKIDSGTGKLSLLDFTSSGGETPRNFTISPNNKFLYAANQDSGSIVSFTLDQTTGKLTELQNSKAETPVCIDFCNE